VGVKRSAAEPCIAFLVLATLSPALSPRAAEQQSTPDGLRLLHEMQDGLGGANSLAAVRDYEETLRAEAWDAAGTALGEVRKRTRWIRTPGLLRLDQIGPRGTYVLYFDGAARSGWEILPDLTSSDKPSSRSIRSQTCRSRRLASRWPIPIVRFRPKCTMKGGQRFQAFASRHAGSVFTAV
jgi:hypothetical protein